MILWMNEGALWGAAILRTALEDAEFHLFKSGEGITINRTLTLAALEAAEADYTGYAAIVITAFGPPILMPGGGAGVNSGSQLFAIASPYSVGNTIGGGWCQSADGDLLFAWNYDPVIGLSGPGQGIPVEQIPVFG